MKARSFTVKTDIWYPEIAPRLLPMYACIGASSKDGIHSSAYFTNNGKYGVHAEFDTSMSCDANCERVVGAIAGAYALGEFVLPIPQCDASGIFYITSQHLGALHLLETWRAESQELPSWYSPIGVKNQVTPTPRGRLTVADARDVVLSAGIGFNVARTDKPHLDNQEDLETARETATMLAVIGRECMEGNCSIQEAINECDAVAREGVPYTLPQNEQASDPY